MKKYFALLFVGALCLLSSAAFACPGHSDGGDEKRKCGANHAHRDAEHAHGCGHKKEGAGCGSHGAKGASCGGSCASAESQQSECGCAKSESCACAGCTGCKHAKKANEHAGCGHKGKTESCSCGAEKPKELKVAPGGKCVGDVDCCCWGGECLGGKDCCKKLSCKS